MITMLRRRTRAPVDAVASAPVSSSDAATGALFSFTDVRVVRGGRTVVELDDTVITDRGPTAIIGPSGSGKSTLLRLCNRLDAPSAGTVRFRGHDLASLEPTVLRRRVAMVFQQPVALSGSVADNLREAAPTLDDDQIGDALHSVGLDGALALRPAQELSGGELQRLALARSLTTGPEVVLLDEATSALDPANAAHIERLVAGLGGEGVTPIWVTHDLDQLVRIADHVVVVADGRVAQRGTVADVLARPIPAVERFLDGERS